MTDPNGDNTGRTQEPPRPEDRKHELIAAGAIVAVALLLAVEPHLASLARRGTYEYMADGDDALYLAIARTSYYDGPEVRDPYASPEQELPSLYAWLQFVPFSVLTRSLGLPPLAIAVVWRAVGAGLFGLSLYALFRRLFADLPKRAAWTLSAALTCLSDPGFVTGRPIVAAFSLAGQMWRGVALLGKGDALPQYRVVTPLLNLPFLLLLGACLIPTKRRPIVRALVGMISLGLCFRLYFFFWTAAIVAMGFYYAGVVIRALVLPSARRDSLRELALGAAILAGGAALGGEQVIDNMRTFGSASDKPALERMIRGRKLAPGNPARIVYVKNYTGWAKLALAAAAVLYFRRSAASILFAFQLAGFLLNMSAVFTGLEFENFHWNYVHSAFSEVLLLYVIVHVLATRPFRKRYVLTAFCLIVGTLVITALCWRTFETAHAREAVKLSALIDETRGLRPALAGLKPNDVIAGRPEAAALLILTRAALLYCDPHSSDSSMNTNRQVHERHALNGRLLCDSIDEYERRFGGARFAAGEFLDRPEWSPAAVREARRAIFRQLEVDPSDLLRRYHPNVLLLASDDPPPAHAGPWRELARTEKWTLWQKTPGNADQPRSEIR